MVFMRKPDPAANANVPPPLKQQPEPSAAAGTAQAAAETAIHDSIIGSDLSIEGQSITIRCRGTLHINGTIQADLHSRALEVGRDALIQGQIAAETVAVHGRVNGAIHGNKVILHSSAEVDGDIHSETLSIEQGATFDGRSRTVRNPGELTLDLDTAAPPPQPSPQPARQHHERKLGPQPFAAMPTPGEGRAFN